MLSRYIYRRNYRTPGNIEQIGAKKFLLGLLRPPKIKKMEVKIFFIRASLDFQKMFFISWCSKIPPTYNIYNIYKTYI